MDGGRRREVPRGLPAGGPIEPPSPRDGAGMLFAGAAYAADIAETAPITFSKFALEVDDRLIGETDATVRDHMLQRMREDGLNVVGGESVLFDIDRSGAARFALGATLTQARHVDRYRYHELELVFEWQLLDV